MSKEEQITAFVQAIAKSNQFSEDQFNLLMHVAVITKYISDGIMMWDEDAENLIKVPPRAKMH